MTYFRSTLFLTALAAALMLGGCHSSSTANQPATGTADQSGAQQPAASAPAQAGNTAAAPAPPPPPAAINLPADTEIRVRLDQDLSSKDAQPGETFQAT